jgi:hypothetical protein
VATMVGDRRYSVDERYSDHLNGFVRDIYCAAVPLLDGVYATELVARDEAGNETRVAGPNINVSTPNNVANIASLVGVTATDQSTLRVTGFARFTSTAGTGRVTVSVSGGDTFEATLEDASALLTGWSAQVTLPGPGPYTLSTVAIRSGSTGPASKEAMLFETNAPTLSVNPVGGAFTRTVTLSGTAQDAGCPIEHAGASLPSQGACTRLGGQRGHGRTWGAGGQCSTERLHRRHVQHSTRHVC